MKPFAPAEMLLSACALAGCAAAPGTDPHAAGDWYPNPPSRYQDLDWHDRRRADIDWMYSDAQRRENKRQREERKK